MLSKLDVVILILIWAAIIAFVDGELVDSPFCPEIRGGKAFLKDRAHADKEGYGPLFLTW